MTCSIQDFTIVKGKTFSRVVQWATTPYVYKAITAITKAAPAVITSTAHGVPDGWPVAIVSVQGMTEINADNPPKAAQYNPATYIDANSISINAINSAEYTAYTSGGYIQYQTPVDMTDFTARMQIRSSADATTTLEELTSVAGDIVIDNTDKTITITISATDTAAYTFTEGVYDLELVSAAGVVTQLLKGAIVVESEVTR